MDIQIEGGRSSSDAWYEARSLSVAKLRELTAQDVDWSNSDEASAVSLARQLCANALTDKDLAAKCVKLARLASDWMKRVGLQGEVVFVRLRTLRGLFDLHVSEDGEIHKLEIREDVVDDLLQGGSREAAESLDRLFAANFGRLAVSKAS